MRIIKKTVTRIKIGINNLRPLLKYAEDPETGIWVGVCDPLNITVDADSKSQLFEEFIGAIESRFTHLAKNGEIDGFLRAHGWETNNPFPKTEKNTEIIFDVPFDSSEVDVNDLALASC